MGGTSDPVSELLRACLSLFSYSLPFVLLDLLLFGSELNGIEFYGLEYLLEMTLRDPLQIWRKQKKIQTARKTRSW